jgi:hypothetical protein
MPIKSYVAYPARGQREALTEALHRLGGCDVACEVFPAENRDLLVVVTDTPDEATEEALQAALARLPALEGLALVAGVGEGEVEAAGHVAAGHLAEEADHESA